MSEKAAKMCSGKKRYHSERKADAAARITQKMTGAGMKSYECEFCDGFHVGAKKQHADGHHQVTRQARFAPTDISGLEVLALGRIQQISTRRLPNLLRPSPVLDAVCPVPLLPIPPNQSNDPAFEDLTSQTFGRLTVVGWAGEGKWALRCECGRFDYRRTATLRRRRHEGEMPQQCNECNKKGFRTSL